MPSNACANVPNSAEINYPIRNYEEQHRIDDGDEESFINVPYLAASTDAVSPPPQSLRPWPAGTSRDTNMCFAIPLSASPPPPSSASPPSSAPSSCAPAIPASSPMAPGPARYDMCKKPGLGDAYVAPTDTHADPDSVRTRRWGLAHGSARRMCTKMRHTRLVHADMHARVSGSWRRVADGQPASAKWRERAWSRAHGSARCVRRWCGWSVWGRPGSSGCSRVWRRPRPYKAPWRSRAMFRAGGLQSSAERRTRDAGNAWNCARECYAKGGESYCARRRLGDGARPPRENAQGVARRVSPCQRACRRTRPRYAAGMRESSAFRSPTLGAAVVALARVVHLHTTLSSTLPQQVATESLISQLGRATIGKDASKVRQEEELANAGCHQ
ncbi:hypothetical protein C8R44DRAFT_731963 [Mycena epipterygia]|nr:hypothetical protein C8R44DRAFT_731963 [Mycena epipterygia]